jgi:hypothetical protein
MRPPAPQWVSVVDDLGISWRGVVVIAGDEAAAVADAFRSAGAPAVVYEERALAVLGDVKMPDGVVSLAGLPDRCAELVVLRRPWASRPEVKQMLGEAARVLGLDGVVVAAEIDAARLLQGSTVRYPSRLQYLANPAAAERLRSTAVERTRLALEVTRAGFVDVVGREVDEERGRYPSPEDYWLAARGGVWRSLSTVALQRRQEILDTAADELERVLPAGEVVDREPWHVISGRR